MGVGMRSMGNWELRRDIYKGGRGGGVKGGVKGWVRVGSFRVRVRGWIGVVSGVGVRVGVRGQGSGVKGQGSGVIEDIDLDFRGRGRPETRD